jgi:hypothetical protein
VNPLARRFAYMEEIEAGHFGEPFSFEFAASRTRLNR